jgi:DNA-binding NtrC family response regulator
VLQVTRQKTARLEDDDARASSGVSARAWLVRLGSASEPLVEPAVYPFETSPLPIGRDSMSELTDPFISGQHAEIHKTDKGYELRDLGSSNGTLHFGQRTSSVLLSDGDVFETGSTFWVWRARPHRGPTPSLDPDAVMKTLSPDLQSVVDRLQRVARTRVPVMLLGDTGTGKEVLARALHDRSHRSGPFVAINTAAIQKSLVASELFGVEKGAHSTAERARLGQVRAADKGTLLLDEIGDMPTEVQVSLLRMLQESEVLPVGGDRPVKVDVRLVCATHQDLDRLVQDGAFRADLYARLNGCVLSIPNLSERIEDLGALVAEFLRRFNADSMVFTPAAYRALALHGWPHNVRELEKTIESAVALSDGARIELSALPEALQKSKPRKSEAPLEGDELAESYQRELVRLLTAHQGNVSAVARSMGKSRMQIHRWLKRLDLDPESFRGGG